MVVYIVVVEDERVGYVYESVFLSVTAAKKVAARINGIVLKVDVVRGREEKI
jgi:hypothetical protein